MVFAYLTYNIENLSNSKIEIVDNVIITIDYDNGYKYSNDSENYCYYKEAGSALTYRGNDSSGSGVILYLNPLSSEDYNVAIPCASAIKDDSQKSLNIIVTITTSDGVEGFVYKIR